MDKLIKRIANISVLIITIAAISASFIYLFSEKEAALNWCFNILYLLVIIVIILLVLFAVIGIFSNKKQLFKTLLLLGCCVVLIVIGYFLAPSELSDIALRLEVAPIVYKWVGTAMNVIYLAFFGVILAFISSIIYVKIKN